MKVFKKKEKELDLEIRSILEQMKEYDAYSEEYTKMAENLEKLMHARSYDTDKAKRTEFAIKVMAIAASLGQVFACIFAEEFKDKIIRTAGKAFIMKPKAI